MTAESVFTGERPVVREGSEASKTASLSMNLEENKLLIIFSVINIDSYV